MINHVYLIIAQCKELVSLMRVEMGKLQKHGGGRARSSDEFVSIQEIYVPTDSQESSLQTYTQTFLV